MDTHYAEPYIVSPQHPITINLIGCGGTGSQVLTNLARISYALRMSEDLQHPGFFVRVFDPDMVSSANIGRQLFSPGEIGQNKAVTMVTKINRFFGENWEARPEYFSSKGIKKEINRDYRANITISCVDTALARMDIKDILFYYLKINDEYLRLQPYEKNYYWLDFGNNRDTGQVVLSTIDPIKQPDDVYSDFKPSSLPTVIDLFPNILEADTEEKQGPSCSLAEALNQQSLFINSTLAQLGCSLLFDLISKKKITYHGLFLNLKMMKVNPIDI